MLTSNPSLEIPWMLGSASWHQILPLSCSAAWNPRLLHLHTPGLKIALGAQSGYLWRMQSTWRIGPRCSPYDSPVKYMPLFLYCGWGWWAHCKSRMWTGTASIPSTICTPLAASCMHMITPAKLSILPSPSFFFFCVGSWFFLQGVCSCAIFFLAKLS